MRVLLAEVFLILAQVLPVSAISISIVYQNPGDSFFTSEAQATLNRAASDVSFAITTSLAGLSQDVYSGTNASTVATTDWSLNYRDPTSTAIVPLNTFNLATNEFRIFVGTQVLDENTLGHGAPGGVGLSLNGTGQESEWQGAVDNMAAASNPSMTRGGPVLGSLAGNVPFGSASAAFNLQFGYTVGSLTLDSSKSWNLSYDSLPTLAQNDLYSVALHEILHDLGLGTGRTWNENVDGLDWNGSSVRDLLASGEGVIDENGAHIAEGLEGRALVDGVFQSGMQEALMSPSLTMGSRKYITDLDLAFMKDMGWDVYSVPEPSSYALLGFGVVCLFGLRYRGKA